MNITDRKAGAAVLQSVLAALGASGRGQTTEAAQLRQAVGALSANAAEKVESFTFGADLRTCFARAVAAGATLSDMNLVRETAAGVIGQGAAVLAVTQTSIRFALIASCRILAATNFVSRQDIDDALTQIVPAFDAATEFAADRLDQVNFRALTALQAAVVRDLTQRARPLPRMVSYTLPRRLPVLALAQLFYGDGGRAGELVAENRGIVHPLFAPQSGRRLSA